MSRNPFDLSFGKKPRESISRVTQTREILDAFTSDAITHQIYMLTGVRGSGKTVLMNTIANELEEEKDWVIIRLNPDRELLPQLVSKLADSRKCAEIFGNARLNLSLFGVGLEDSGTQPLSDIETAIEQMMKSLKNAGKRVLLTIDEVTNHPYIRTFASSFQILIGQELPVFLLMTGLYENIEELQNEKNLTFLYRAPRIRMNPLNLGMVAARYEKVFSVPYESARNWAALTNGYPFAFQALGYSIWNNPVDKKAYMVEYRQLLEEFVYEKIWSELSSKDKRIAAGIAHCPDGKLCEIVAFLRLKPDEINQYRRRLIRKGIVNGEEHGRLRFTLPLFDRFVLDREAAER